MKNNEMKKNERRWTAMLAMLLCAVLTVTAVTGCGAKAAQPTAPQPINDQTELTSHTEPTEPAGPAESTETSEPEPTEEFAVEITDLGDGTFRVKDAGFTPGLDLTVKLPESWAGRYTCQVFDNEIAFYCKAAYEISYDEGYHGYLCGIWVRDEVMSPDDPLWGDSRVLAVADNYSVVLSYPGDVQFTAETWEEYQSMYADKEKVEITMSEQMLANS